MTRITINGITIDPETQEPQLAALSLSTTDTSGSNFALIQVDGPINEAQRTEFEAQHVELLEYVPENTYIARFEGDDLSAVQALSFVTWTNRYLQGFKVSTDLIETPSLEGAEYMRLAETDDPGGQGTEEVDIVFHMGVQPENHVAEVSSAAGLDQTTLEVSGKKIRAIVDNSRMRAVAAIDEVRHIEKVFPTELSNDVAVTILAADVVHTGNPGFRGTGQVVAVCDTGFDTGSTKNVHPAFTGRVNNLYDRGRPGLADDPHGHGTHVAGSVLGDGNANNHGPVMGTAPSAKLVLQSVLDSSGGLSGLPADLNDLFDETYTNDDARIHTNSWGSRYTAGRYTSNSKEVDEFVWNHRDQVVCFAAGNPGRDSNSNGEIDLGSVLAPGTAKNCITVGATENYRPQQSKLWSTGTWRFRFPEDPIFSDLWADDPNGMAAFSGRGPTKDGRIRPDVVAPGTSIISAHSRKANVGNSWGVSPDPAYCYMGGTSMATPLVAGCVAVLREALANQHGMSQPSAALIKAMIINGAVDLPGQYTPTEAGPNPNNSEGFGRVDLMRSIAICTNTRLSFYDESQELLTDDEEHYAINVQNGVTLKVTLVWTDYPGASLVNDLDLIVRANGEERHGNAAPVSTDFDRINNVEQIVWCGLDAGTVDIIVRAYRVPLYSQSFALVLRVD